MPSHTSLNSTQLTYQAIKGSANSNDPIFNNVDVLIKQFGYAIFTEKMTKDSIPVAYTIGLCKRFQLPELLLFGIPLDIAPHLLNDIVDKLSEEEKILCDGDVLTGIANFSLAAKRITPQFANKFAQKACEFNQDHSIDGDFFIVYWPDEKACFPWDSNFNAQMKHIQPLENLN